MSCFRLSILAASSSSNDSSLGIFKLLFSSCSFSCSTDKELASSLEVLFSLLSAAASTLKSRSLSSASLSLDIINCWSAPATISFEARLITSAVTLELLKRSVSATIPVSKAVATGSTKIFLSRDSISPETSSDIELAFFSCQFKSDKVLGSSPIVITPRLAS